MTLAIAVAGSPGSSCAAFRTATRYSAQLAAATIAHAMPGALAEPVGPVTSTMPTAASAAPIQPGHDLAVMTANVMGTMSSIVTLNPTPMWEKAM